jgi:hypothetical protein
MPRLHFVNKARKNHKEANVKKGESYYWWAFRIGRSSSKHYSKTKPRRSQLTMSEFYSGMYDFEDNMPNIDDEADPSIVDDIRGTADEVRSFGDEQNEKADNMESAWPNGNPTIDLLRERAESCESIAQEIESACDSVDPEGDTDWRSNFQSELEGVSWSYS